MDNDKLNYNITSVEDYLDVFIDPVTVVNIIEETELEHFKPVYVTAYFLLKPDLVSS